MLQSFSLKYFHQIVAAVRQHPGTPGNTGLRGDAWKSVQTVWIKIKEFLTTHIKAKVLFAMHIERRSKDCQ